MLGTYLLEDNETHVTAHRIYYTASLGVALAACYRLIGIGNIISKWLKICQSANSYNQIKKIHFDYVSILRNVENYWFECLWVVNN